MKRGLTFGQFLHAFVALTLIAGSAAQAAQTPAPTQAAPEASSEAPGVPKAIEPPAGFVIGPDDVLAVLFWREKDLSAEVVVRPDGMISLPLLNDVRAAGLAPEELRQQLMDAASRYVNDPSVTVFVKTINSRKVFISGMVAKPGTYSLTAPMTVVQLLATAGGLLEFADRKKITILRTENGSSKSFKFNYDEVAEGKNLAQNIELKPGDTVFVR